MDGFHYIRIPFVTCGHHLFLAFFFFFFVDHIIFFWLDLVDIPPNAQNLAGLLTFFWRFLSFVSISPPPLVDLRDGW